MLCAAGNWTPYRLAIPLLHCNFELLTTMIHFSSCLILKAVVRIGRRYDGMIRLLIASSVSDRPEWVALPSYWTLLPCSFADVFQFEPLAIVVHYCRCLILTGISDKGEPSNLWSHGVKVRTIWLSYLLFELNCLVTCHCTVYMVAHNLGTFLYPFHVWRTMWAFIQATSSGALKAHYCR